MTQDDVNSKIIDELESIKRLLILQLTHAGLQHSNVAKAAGMSTKTLSKFLPKTRKANHNKKKKSGI